MKMASPFVYLFCRLFLTWLRLLLLSSKSRSNKRVFFFFFRSRELSIEALYNNYIIIKLHSPLGFEKTRGSLALSHTALSGKSK